MTDEIFGTFREYINQINSNLFETHKQNET